MKKMSAYIRSNITNSAEGITFQLGASTTKFSPSGEFNKIVGVSTPIEPWEGTSKDYVDTKISDLIDGAPDLLNTLNEIAQAINDDESFGNTIIAQLSNKLDLSGGILTGSLILNDNPITALGAATKQYVDNLTNSITVSSTDDVPEGSALYFTDARVRDAISVSGSLSYNNATGVISYTTPVANINSLSDVDTTTITPLVGMTLIWDGSNWVPGASTSSVLADASLDGGSFD
jgi:hypothetical protein